MTDISHLKHNGRTDLFHMKKIKKYNTKTSRFAFEYIFGISLSHCLYV